MKNSDEVVALSPEAFAALGVGKTFYIRPVQEDGITAFAIHTAAGQPVGVMPSVDHARAAAIQNDMELASIH